VKGYVVGNKLNGVRLRNGFEKRKIGCKEHEVLVLAQCGNWEAQLALEVYLYGQVFILPKKPGGKESSKNGGIVLGKGPIKDKVNLIELIDVVSRVIVEGLRHKIIGECCERVYLAALSESDDLHFWLFPRYEKDREKVEKVSGFFLISDYVREYLQRSDKSRKEKGCKYKGPFVSFKHECNEYKSYKKYAEECQKWFAKGWKEVQKNISQGIKCRTTK
jgi:hypothetical protein